MTEKEIGENLDSIRKDMRLFDSIIRTTDYETGEGKITKKQVEIVKKLFDLFQSLNWQISFNDYKELKVKEGSKAIDTRKCGTPVRISPCKKECKGKTYFGILLGDMALSISHSISDDGIVTAEHSFHNPAIFVPELNDIIYGCESWWGEIESEEELKNLITEDTIKNVWYVKMLEQIATGKEEREDDRE